MLAFQLIGAALLTLFLAAAISGGNAAERR
jgi:hypothetical protein